MKFKVGDRVAVYYSHPSQALPARVTGTIGYIFSPEDQYPPNFSGQGEDCFQVEQDNKNEFMPSYVHPKQCRKLKKPREIWVNEYDEASNRSYANYLFATKEDADIFHYGRSRCIKFREVKEKK